MSTHIFENKKNIVAAFFGCWAIQLALGITVRNPLTVVFFVLILLLGERIDKYSYDKARKRTMGRFLAGYAMSIIVSGALTIFTYKRVTASFASGLFKAMAIAIMFCGFICLGLMVTGVLSAECKDIRSTDENYSKDFSGGSSFRQILIVMGICLICWLPYFLYEFPGIMTADSLVQYDEIYGAEPWSNHHPVIHTLLIWLFTKIGYFFTGNKSISIAFYTVFQMIFLSFCCGVAIGHINGRKKKIVATCFFALVPFNAVFAVTVWKDIIFAAVSILLICKVMDLRKSGSTAVNWGLFTFYAIVFALLRSNAWYALIIWAAFFIYAFSNEYKKALISFFIVFLTVIVIKGPVMKAFGVGQPDFVESLSVPAQQIARVLVEDEDFSDGDMQLIRDVIDTTYIKELYAPAFADNIKELIRAGHPEILEANKGAYFGLWFRTVTHHPVLAVKAWFDLVGGYIYPDVIYGVGDVDGIMFNTYGLEWMPIIGGKLIVKGKEILIKLGNFVPLYGMLWSIGAYTWLLVIALLASIKMHKDCLCKALMLLLTSTLLIAAPVVDFRYGYAVVMTMPIWIGSLFDKGNMHERAD